MKKSALVLTIILIICLCFGVVSAAENEIAVTVSGENVSFDASPVIIDGRTYVPVRAIFEAMGASVEWDAASQTVYAEKLGKTVEFTIGEKEAAYNGKKVKMDASALIIDERTFVPARYAAEGFGYVVEWDDRSRTVTILHDTENMKCYEGTNIPDYGALYSFEYIKTEDGVYIYDTADITERDKEALSIRDYTDILYELGAVFSGEQKIAREGAEGTLYTFVKDETLLFAGVISVEGEAGFFIAVRHPEA